MQADCGEEGIAARAQVGNVKKRQKRQSYIRRSCGAARALCRLVDTASFIIRIIWIIWMDISYNIYIYIYLYIYIYIIYIYIYISIIYIYYILYIIYNIM